MKYLLLAPLFLTSYTTLEALSGEEPAPFRALYVPGGHTVEADEGVAHVGLSLRVEDEDVWTGDLFVDRIDGVMDESYVAGAGLRYFLATKTVLQPYVGAGVSAALENSASDDRFGGYGRAGVEVELGIPLRLTLDWHGYAAGSGDDSIVTVGLGWSF